MRRGATILVNEDAFSVRAVQKAGYDDVNPLEDGTLDGFTVKRDPDELARPRAPSRTSRASRAATRRRPRTCSRSAC